MEPKHYNTNDDNTNEIFKYHSNTIIDNYQKDFLPLLALRAGGRASRPRRADPLHRADPLRRADPPRRADHPGRADSLDDDDHYEPFVEPIIEPNARAGSVAVIGAGVSGLQVARKLAAEGKPVDVYEASNRTGGRLYTYKFPGGGEWDYFDVGAMRFPNTTVMKPTYDLFEELDIPLLDYQMSSPDNWLCYNSRPPVRRADAAGQDFGVRVTDGGTVPDDWVDIGIEQLMDNVYGRFLVMLRENFQQGYRELMTYDEHSTRSFMAFVELPQSGQFPEKRRYPTSVINWLEARRFSTGWFDRAFSETVLEALAFAEGLPGAEFRCVKGGSQRITDRMVELLRDNDRVTIHTSRPVAAVNYDPDQNALSVTWKTLDNPNIVHITPGYSQVVLTASPQAMRQMDLSTCMLDSAQRNALLMLQPGPSIKIGMKFNSNWWAGQEITGGQSQTDRPARVVVYPSHGNGESTVLIASYCWTQDATNLGAWMNSPHYHEQLRDLILGDLSAIHDIPLIFLREQYQAMYAYDWAQDPRTIGAYAFFGPGQFSFLYENLTRPAAGGHLHFAGEAISTCHAWVAGAVDSANRVVNQILEPPPPPQDLAPLVPGLGVGLAALPLVPGLGVSLTAPPLVPGQLELQLPLGQPELQISLGQSELLLPPDQPKSLLPSDQPELLLPPECAAPLLEMNMDLEAAMRQLDISDYLQTKEFGARGSRFYHTPKVSPGKPKDKLA